MEKAVTMPDVKVYSTKQCQYCRLLKAFLDKKGIKYQNIDVGEDIEAAKEMVELSGQYAVPVTVIDGEVIVGYDVRRLNELFGDTGEKGEIDIIILGGGPAGLTAAAYAARKLLRCMIITEDIGGQALESWAIENYMGFRIISGSDLMQKFEEQVRNEDIEIEIDRAESIEESNGKFVITTVSGQKFEGKSVIIATGVKPRWLGIKDEEKYIGHGISICSTCDGPLFRDKIVTIVGGGNYAVTTAIEMSKLATHVNLIVRSKIRADEVYTSQYEGLENVSTYKNYTVSALEGDNMLKAVTIKERDTGEESKLETDGLFLAIGHDANTGFLEGFVDLNENGEIITDNNGRTSHNGVFAAGDVTDTKSKQVIIASGEGAKAALSAYSFLVNK
ncbi:FAD-dependent pyridine nucleotide-disulfide oxidoreductase [Methanolacinia petrolearia DSM 11571]|uniref:FAD-dependent pyridine nucleotide-disulfide oxidoreductase n=2 Tax=Methanolacinia TaxID=230355 RepID=E1RFR8_METP4|nr:FAD-dependent pyridine nucleotide-disulfide oxidoreductase [Methanolacinia petrolearia DSM 11571]